MKFCHFSTYRRKHSPSSASLQQHVPAHHRHNEMPEAWSLDSVVSLVCSVSLHHTQCRGTALLISQKWLNVRIAIKQLLNILQFCIYYIDHCNTITLHLHQVTAGRLTSPNRLLHLLIIRSMSGGILVRSAILALLIRSYQWIQRTCLCHFYVEGFQAQSQRIPGTWCQRQVKSMCRMHIIGQIRQMFAKGIFSQTVIGIYQYIPFEGRTCIIKCEVSLLS